MLTINNLGGFIIDMDGVLWHGNKPLPGLTEFFSILRKVNIPFVLATNNASLTQQQYIDKLANMEVEVHPNEILTSSMATARYLKDTLSPAKRRVFVIGESGLIEPLQQQGFEVTSTYYPTEPQATTDNIWADLVVSGLDRKLSWDKLATATLNIRAGAEFYATNADTTLPTELGEVMGNGGVLAALTAATGVKPIVIGKPEPILYQQAFEILGTDKHNTIAIGDRLDTDILGAVNAGMRSMMVLTGVSSEVDLAEIDYRPDWIFQDIQEITTLLKQL
ncbi:MULTISPECIES: HAD-IIA family hydrolase [Methylophaga]|uniref:Putative hydrolase YutF n=1 Tax=Methylophaga muralis TaxID=291169 RepID=A0A1E3GSN2_9GAMM|nr:MULTISPECIES: HAD-IIA family hydrolase [Methylophaga]ODN66391.1 putative hydrolase YutF [Methylophaga muralis]THK41386.1 HAD-IIA family hydrolase [Methylophaga sp. SB9B]